MGVLVVYKVILLLTKGIIRDQVARRKMMFWIMLVALVMLFAGSVFIPDQWARQHPWTTIAYWGVCALLTFTGMLLALLDILLIRAMHRAARRAMERGLLGEEPKDKQ